MALLWTRLGRLFHSGSHKFSPYEQQKLPNGSQSSGSVLSRKFYFHFILDVWNKLHIKHTQHFDARMRSDLSFTRLRPMSQSLAMSVLCRKVGNAICYLFNPAYGWFHLKSSRILILTKKKKKYYVLRAHLTWMVVQMVRWADSSFSSYGLFKGALQKL